MFNCTTAENFVIETVALVVLFLLHLGHLAIFAA
jgi:hypothetical protein